jgi:hypothetical protein
MTELPPLHPERVKDAYERLQSAVVYNERVVEEPRLDAQEIETCLAALRLVQRGQAAVGFTHEIANAGGALAQAAREVGKVIRKRR